MAGTVPAVYLHVVDDVISKVKDEFLNYGAGEAVLQELQAQWEARMMQCGVISSTSERISLPKPAAPAAPVHDLNVPYEGPIEEYETPTAEMLFPPTPMQNTVQTPLPGTAEQGMYNIPTAPSEYAPSPITDIMSSFDLKSSRPSPYLPQSPWISQRSPLGVDVNVAYGDGQGNAERGAAQPSPIQDFFPNSSGKRKRDENLSQTGGFLPQQDGSSDFPMESFLQKTSQTPICYSREGQKPEFAKMLSDPREFQLLPQQDGVNDEENDNNVFHFQGVATEDYNAVDNEEQRVSTPFVGTPRPGRVDAAIDDEPPLNEDDDDLDDLDQEEHEPATQDLVLAQFDKVSRTKSRWKCILKDGIMHLNDKELLFNKANGEFEF